MQNLSNPYSMINIHLNHDLDKMCICNSLGWKANDLSNSTNLLKRSFCS